MSILIPNYVPNEAELSRFPALVVEWEIETSRAYGVRARPAVRPYERYPEPKRETEDSGSVREVIAASEWITGLDDDWDGEGAVGYSRVTWDTATKFLLSLANEAAQFGRVLPVPDISPADAGSIDLFWRIGARSLLVNIAGPNGQGATFYGQDRTGNTLSGSINPISNRPDLVAWLTQLTEP